MFSQVVVTGMGIYSALGKGQEENFLKLKRAEHGFSSLHQVPTIWANEFPFGEINRSTEELAIEAGLDPQVGITRTSILGIHAIQEALAQAEIDLKNQTLRIGLINASTVGGMCEVEKYYFSMLQESDRPLRYTDTIDIADCTHRIADYFGIHHLVTSISTACSSSSNAIQFGARLLQQGLLDVAICGGTDGLSTFTINGFNALKNLDRSYCKPFDANRNGLNLGEGAAYVVLERKDDAQQRSKPALATFSGWSNFNESFHPTAPNPQGEGAFQVMKRALTHANLQAQDIDYINAHGTATLTNDESESKAMLRLFDKMPAFSSTKSFTGHTLAAAGAIEAVYSILALKEQAVFPNLHFTEPIPELGLIPQLQFEYKTLNHVMSNSYAFGGNNTSLIFSLI